MTLDSISISLSRAIDIASQNTWSVYQLTCVAIGIGLLACVMGVNARLRMFPSVNRLLVLMAGAAVAPYLVLDAQNVQDLIDRYPRIAAKIPSILPSEATQSWPNLFATMSLGAYAVVTTCAVVLVLLATRNREIYLRGTRVVDVAPVAALGDRIRWLRGRAISIGGVLIPRKYESRHILLIGVPGTRKSSVLTRALDVIRARGERGIVFDPDGELMSRHYRPGDWILSVDRGDSAVLDIAADVQKDADCAAVSESLIPEGTGEARDWNIRTRSLVTVVAQSLRRQKQLSAKNLYHWLVEAPIADLKQLCAGTEASRLFEPGAEKMLASTVAIMGQHARMLGQLPTTGRRLSLREFAAPAHRSEIVWVHYESANSDNSASLRRYVADQILRHKCSPTKRDTGVRSTQRLWLALDELRLAGHLPQLPDASARGRKYGLALLMAIQDLSQLRALYGRDVAQSVIACAGIKVILRAADPDGAKYYSEMIGESEIERPTQSNTYQAGGLASLVTMIGRHSTTRGTHRERIHPVLSSQLENLPDGVGYLHIVEGPWIHITITRMKSRPNHAPPYNARDEAKVEAEGESSPQQNSPSGKLQLLPSSSRKGNCTPDAPSAAADPDPNSGEKKPGSDV